MLQRKLKQTQALECIIPDPYMLVYCTLGDTLHRKHAFTAQTYVRVSSSSCHPTYSKQCYHPQKLIGKRSNKRKYQKDHFRIT